MTRPARSFRNALMACAACALAATALPARAGDSSDAQVNLGQVQLAQAAPATGRFGAGNQGGGAIAPNVSANAPESIVVRAKRLLQKEKNSPSAVTELGQKQIAAVGVSGSPASLLRQAPSIYVYQQSLGDNAPELTVRGLRGLEIATTLDGVPTQDLLAPGSFYLSNNIGGVFTLNQISSVSIYPGVAYPDKNTFGTIGGTIAYDSKRPTDDMYLDLVGSAGSFGTYKEGFELNSGQLDSPLGTGDNAVKMLLNYYNFQTQGFIDGTPNRENEMEFALDKPYDDGLSDFQVTVLYNTANGLIQNEPVPLPYLNRNGYFSNYPTNLDSVRETNDYKTLILKDDTYINDYLTVGMTAFYIGNNNSTLDYSNVALATPLASQNPLSVGGSTPFVNNPAGFNYGKYYGPGGVLYQPPHYTYNPRATFPAGSPACPQSYVDLFTAYNTANPGAGLVDQCGVNAQLTTQHTDTYGLQPRVTIIPPEIFGVGNTIKIGGLFAKETSPSGQSYLWGTPDVPQSAANLASIFGGGFDGGVQRTIYQGYAQDKIDLLDNTLHVTPGFTVEGTDSSFRESAIFSGTVTPAELATPYCSTPGNTCAYGHYKATKWDRDWLPFVNVAYDFDKILPAAKGLTAYGSFGNSALFAPVTDFGPNIAGPPPYASIVHMYEGGLKYDTSNLLVSADYFYQKIDRDFGFFNYQSGPNVGLSQYSSIGQREIKGVEGNVIWQATPDLQFFGNFSHLLAKYLTSTFAFVTVAEDQFGIAFKGAPVSGVPDWLSTFGADYTKKSVFVDTDKFDIRFTGQYTGHQSTTYDIGGFATVPSFPQLSPPGPCAPPGVGSGCTRFSQLSGATVYDPHGGIPPFAVFGVDLNYQMPTPYLGPMKSLTFDLNVQNLFDERYFQYFYKQVSPSICAATAANPIASQYNCTPTFADGIPGQPFSAFFTVTARFF